MSRSWWRAAGLAVLLAGLAALSWQVTTDAAEDKPGTETLPPDLARVPARARLSRAERLERRMSESCLECLRASPSPPPASPPEARAWRAGWLDATMQVR